jgi:TfoX/Sxy family transcriptional regulator of competence genes
MAYDHKLADRIRERLSILPHVREKEMMGGVVFMYKDKMCVGVIKDEMMCRIEPALHEALVERTGCRTMDFTHRPMKGYILVDETGMKNQNDFEYWIELCLEFNDRAKSSRKKQSMGKGPSL